MSCLVSATLRLSGGAIARPSCCASPLSNCSPMWTKRRRAYVLGSPPPPPRCHTLPRASRLKMSPQDHFALHGTRYFANVAECEPLGSSLSIMKQHVVTDQRNQETSHSALYCTAHAVHQTRSSMTSAHQAPRLRPLDRSSLASSSSSSSRRSVGSVYRGWAFSEECP